LIQIDVDPWFSESKIVEGDHRITEESIDVESKVGIVAVSILQERDVTPASWPTRRASNVTENC
jgi:hypothetical protein